ncbi:hypothetical protein FM038_011560 [Shewanella eurypsychrophilus]|uniref:Uncharacterized protein n=1 Tax=Shewanella eurypsychrophilus TaxID=2593656 RepID=A0ABX6V5W5_9GAMM|nr:MULTISPECIES: hypothetical protein [Shewanella]QFU22729.1 hypothetical protein FS418_13140 [Shewanella sp. YLB-09]QPG58018.1 hypothetical protein FM038_011560 [Shewanella eurypsychrophilus]
MMLKIWPLILVIGLNVFILALSMIAEVINPSICWTPRFGGLLVGLAVFMQGYLQANPKKYNTLLSNQTTVRQWLHHAIYVASILGTIMWAFGDLFGSFLWLSNSSCVV